MHAYTCVCTCAYARTHMNIPPHTHTRIRTHTHTHIRLEKSPAVTARKWVEWCAVHAPPWRSQGTRAFLGPLPSTPPKLFEPSLPACPPLCVCPRELHPLALRLCTVPSISVRPSPCPLHHSPLHLGLWWPSPPPTFIYSPCAFVHHACAMHLCMRRTGAQSRPGRA